MLRLGRFVLGEVVASRSPILFLLVLSGLLRGALILVINSAAAQTSGEGLWYYGLAFSAALAAFLLLAHLARTGSQVLIENVILRLRLRLCDGLLKVRSTYLLGRETGAIYNTLTEEVNRVGGISVQLLENVQAAVLLAFCIPYVFWLSPLGGLAVSTAIVIGTAAYLLQDRWASELIEKARLLEATFFDRVADVLKGFKEIRLNDSRRQDLRQDISTCVERTGALVVQAERLFSISFLTTQAIIFGLLGFLALGLPMLPGGDRTIVFQFLTVVLFAVGPLETVLGSYSSLVRARVALERINELERDLAAATELAALARKPALEGSFQCLELRNVEARLSDTSSPPASNGEQFILGPINLSIRRGEIIFVTGGNGSGKTTLFSVLCALREPDSGTLILDGIPVTPDRLSAYRNLFSAVFDDFHLFHTLYGLGQIDQAQADRLITALDLSHRTAIRHGRPTSLALSAGQKRRLALVMALLENRPILLLDEFAADQDPEHRVLFYERLLPSLKADGKTIIAITHDETRFHLCDRRFHMDAGRIVVGERDRYATTARGLNGFDMPADENEDDRAPRPRYSD